MTIREALRAAFKEYRLNQAYDRGLTPSIDAVKSDCYHFETNHTAISGKIKLNPNAHPMRPYMVSVPPSDSYVDELKRKDTIRNKEALELVECLNTKIEKV